MAIVYVINEIGWEYNDNYWEYHEQHPVEAYRDQAKAQAECDRLNARDRSQRDHIYDESMRPITQFFCVSSITVMDM